MFSKKRRYIDRLYIEFISYYPCLRCGLVNSDGRCDPHHERHLGGGGMALKPHDTHCVPLCHTCHVKRDGWRGPITYEESNGYEEPFYPRHIDLKLSIIGYLTEYLKKRKEKK